jgi:hypothetical protein
LPDAAADPPRRALEFTAAEIRLRVRSADGWPVRARARIAGDIAAADIAALRAAAGPPGSPPAVDIWLPPEHVLETRVMGVGGDAGAAARAAEAAIAARVDAPLADMAWALGPIDADGGAALAAADRTTVKEARRYAAAWGFAPISVRAAPSPAFPDGAPIDATGAIAQPSARTRRPLRIAGGIGAIAALALLFWSIAEDEPAPPERLAEPPTAAAPAGDVATLEVETVAPSDKTAPTAGRDGAPSGAEAPETPAPGDIPVETETAALASQPDPDTGPAPAPALTTPPQAPSAAFAGAAPQRPETHADAAPQGQAAPDAGATTDAVPDRSPAAPSLAPLDDRAAFSEAQADAPAPPAPPREATAAQAAGADGSDAPARVAALTPADPIQPPVAAPPPPPAAAPPPFFEAENDSGDPGADAPAADARPPPPSPAPDPPETEAAEAEAAPLTGPEAAPAPPARPERVVAAVTAPALAPPRPRPANLARPPAPARAAARAPTTGGVAHRATRSSAIELDSLSLIGVFSGSDGRSAMMRLPDGGIRRVRRGDRLEGWTVSAIDDSSVELRNGSQRRLISVPR